ncbi:MAG: hypothetical protein AB1349_13925 [Elusimicrobiota bacterium]
MLIKDYLKNNPDNIQKLNSYSEEVLIFLELNLKPVEKILNSLYAEKSRGRPHKDPVKIFRSLLLMTALNETGITEFSKRLKREEILAVLCQWEPDDTPSTGTFYNFIYRLQDGPYKKPCCHIEKPSQSDKGTHRRNLRNEKLQKAEKEKQQQDYDENDLVTDKLTKFLLKHTDEARQEDLLKRLEDIFMSIAIKPSYEKGLLGDIEKLDVSGDGSCIKSGANENGKPTCRCFRQGIKKCGCDRLYKDPDADWGYDSYNERFYFGDKFYQICNFASKHNLPLHIFIGPASETDYTLSLKSFDRMLKLFKEHDFPAIITGASFDKGHDAMGIYDYFFQKNIPVAIPLNKRGEKVTIRGIKFSENGVPICKGGLPMRYHGYNPRKKRHLYCCPVKKAAQRDNKRIYIAYPEECPLKVLCEPDTVLSPTVHVSIKSNLRIFPVIPRDSKRYKELYKERTATERSNSAKKFAYPLERALCKSRAHRIIRLYLISIIEHKKAIYKEETKGLTKEQILELILKKIEMQ